MHNRILFLTLKVFSATGGIEKVCRVAGKAMYEASIVNNSELEIYSMHDPEGAAEQNKYFPAEIFRGFGAHKSRFMSAAVAEGKNSRIVILSHVNLLLAGWMIKKISPHTRVILLAHGIEIWNRLTTAKSIMLGCCDEIISVSHFTSQKIQEVHGISPARCRVLNNCLDPFLPLPSGMHKNPVLLSRYGFTPSDKILFTLSRLSSRERYKGYEKVLQAMIGLRERHNGLRYLLAGSFDPEEKAYLDKLLEEFELTDSVVLPGYIPDEELEAHFSMADIYVMPSMKEGFGIVFIEAMYYGLPVIAGNQDGSVDALCQGELGILVDPQDINELVNALDNILLNKDKYIPSKNRVIELFGYDVYKKGMNRVINETGQNALHATR